MREFDFLVLGGGIAGLTYALEVAKLGSVGVLFKKQRSQSSTAWAQGGIAAVTADDDNFELHIEDTLTAGAGLCNRSAVELVVREGPQRVEELIKLGTVFDKDDSGYHLHREGGHSRRRIFHAADRTGYEIQRALLVAAQANSRITFFEDTNAVDIITTRKISSRRKDIPGAAGNEYAGTNRALGAYVLLPDGEIEAFVADKIFVATGGAGRIYLYTSNPDVATGDGIAMCYRAGARVANLEFFQFHPTCLYHPQARNFLITEAMRGEGAKLRRINGDEFMHKYHPLKELAPRDVVARAIDNEMKTHGEDNVLLDISHRPPEFVREHFPTIYARCKELGFDITCQPIPVVPAAHYLCGGVVSDEFGQTGIDDLYVGGESACTGLHGANRLASNSLLEGLVYGYRAAQHSIQNFKKYKSDVHVPLWDSGPATDSDEQVVIAQNWDEIRRFMWNYVGIVRTTKRLERALHRSETIEQEIKDYYWNFKVTPDFLELRNLSLVANLVIRSALSRKESRGLHYNTDFPDLDPAGAKDTILTPSVTSLLA
jgi:L-aspartate oxidase